MVVNNFWKRFLIIMTLTLKTKSQAIYNAEYNDYEATTDIRSMPPELESKKTEHELEMEDCMDDFVKCFQSLGIHFKKSPICGKDPTTGKTRSFDNMCHLAYDTCKHDGAWLFEKNGPCHEDEWGEEERLLRVKSLRRHWKLWLRGRSNDPRLLAKRRKKEKLDGDNTRV